MSLPIKVKMIGRCLLLRNCMRSKLSNLEVKTTVTPIENTTQGIITALSAFCIWGCFPLYFKQLGAYDSTEIIAHRIFWTFALLLIVILLTRRFNWIKQFRESPKLFFLTFISGMIISVNWLTYVWAVNNNHLLEASLGYYLSPLMGVGLSLVVLKEKLRKLQWVAIGFAVLSVFLQVMMLGKLPWVSLVLALSFGVYGLMQRQTPLMAVDALFVETALLLPFVLIWLQNSDVASSHLDLWLSNEIWLLMLAGPITLIPLLLFNKSTKMVAFSVLSFMNYLTPTFLLFLAIYYYKEPFDIQNFGIFGLIWVALIIFSIDLVLIKNRLSK